MKNRTTLVHQTRWGISRGGRLLTACWTVLVPFLVVGVLGPSTAGAQEIQSLEHDTALGVANSLVQVDADTYALAYAGDGADGFITTFTISADGTTITEVASLEHDTGLGRHNSLVQVDAAFDGDSGSPCDQVRDLDAGTTQVTSEPLADGAWYGHVCAVDQAGNWSPVTTAGPYLIDTAAPTVERVTTVAAPAAGELPDGASTVAAITQIHLDFSRAMWDPPGDSDPGDVTRPGNYLLFTAGADGVFDTTGCAGGVDPADVAVAVDTVSYLPASDTAALWVGGGVPLAADAYRMVLCDSLRDEVGNALDGDGDGDGDAGGDAGGELTHAFAVEATDLLLNPNFDLELEPWLLIGPDVVVPEIAHDAGDADGAVTSGSALISDLVGQEEVFALAQCLTLDADELLALRGRVRVEVLGDVDPTFFGKVDFFELDACTGVTLASVTAGGTEPDSGELWLPLSLESERPARAVSALVTFGAFAGAEDSGFRVAFDNLFFGRQTVIFADGFESGDTTAWSSTTSP